MPSLRVAAQGAGELCVVELVFPTRDDHRCYAIADQVRDRTRLAHEAIDPEDKGHPGYRYRRDDRERRRERDEPGPGDA